MTTRPGRPRSEASRLAVLAATRAQLAESGWDGLGFDRVARAAGVGKQTVYRWWPTKAALVAELLLEGGLLPARPVPSTGDVRADLATWLRSVGRVEDDQEAVAVLRAIVAATAEDAGIAARYDEQVTTVARDQLVARLDAAVASGELPAGTRPDVVAEAVIGVVLYRLVTRRRLDGTAADDLAVALLPPARSGQPGTVD